MCKTLVRICLALWVLAAANSALAQECPPPRQGLFDQFPSVERSTNPVPGEQDLTLPMPCGGSMVFRAVCVPAEGYLYDFQADLGCDDCERPDMAYMERRRRESVSGPFTLEDLPPEWRTQLTNAARLGDGRCPAPDDPTATAFYYFVARYEVSRFQWQAVMGGACEEAAIDGDSPRPMTEVSWYEAIEFTQRYTEWLLENAPQSLPRLSDKNPGFIRLPTEAEWEYAARGGHRAKELEISQEPFFPMAEDTEPADYAVFSELGAARTPENLAWIGSRCANPLGLHDTAGNASEMVLDLFRFSLGLRLHGTTGGVVLKGGSYLKGLNEILPGRREELPLFIDAEAFRARDVGFRVAISAIVTPEERLEAMMEEWAEAGEAVALSRNDSWFDDTSPSRDPIAEIDRLVAASDDEEEIDNLLYLKGIIKDNNIALEERSADAARGVIRSALLTVETIMNYAFRRQVIRDKRVEFEALSTQNLTENEQAQLDNAIREADRFMAMLDRAIDESVLFYINRVKESRDFPQDMFDAQLMRVRDELAGDDPFNEVLLKRFGVYQLHVQEYRQNVRGVMLEESVIADIIPENYR